MVANAARAFDQRTRLWWFADFEVLSSETGLASERGRAGGHATSRKLIPLAQGRLELDLFEFAMKAAVSSQSLARRDVAAGHMRNDPAAPRGCRKGRGQIHM